MTEESRIDKLELRCDRYDSDMESEKDTRKRRNDKIDQILTEHTLKIDRVENSMGIIARVVWIVIAVIASLVIHAIHDIVTAGN